MKRKQLAINSISTRANSLNEMLAAYAKAGFKNVECCLTHVYDYLNEGHSVEEVQELLDKHKLQFIGGFQTALLCFRPEKERLANHKQVIENAELVGKLGGRVLVVGTDGPDKGQNGMDPLDKIAKTFAQVAKRIKKTGVTICLEFNWGPLVKSLPAAVEVARRSKASNVGVLFDPAHFHCTPTKLEHLSRKNVPYIRHVHLNDMRDKPGELSHCNNDRVLPGKGCLDLKAILRLLERHGYRGYYSIEMFNDKLWAMPVKQASRQMYQSLLPLCG